MAWASMRSSRTVLRPWALTWPMSRRREPGTASSASWIARRRLAPRGRRGCAAGSQVAEAQAEQPGVDRGAAGLGVAAAFEHEDRRPFAPDLAVAARVEGPHDRRGVVLPRRENAHRAAADAVEDVHLRARPAGQHHVGRAPLG